jgi:hypothetical protein
MWSHFDTKAKPRHTVRRPCCSVNDVPIGGGTLFWGGHFDEVTKTEVSGRCVTQRKTLRSLSRWRSTQSRWGSVRTCAWYTYRFRILLHLVSRRNRYVDMYSLEAQYICAHEMSQERSFITLVSFLTNWTGQYVGGCPIDITRRQVKDGSKNWELIS